MLTFEAPTEAAATGTVSALPRNPILELFTATVCPNHPRLTSKP